jgi:hypothetical protein
MTYEVGIDQGAPQMFAIKILAGSFGVIIGIVLLLTQGIPLVTHTASQTSAIGAASTSNAQGDIANIRSFETLASDLSDGCVTNLSAPLPLSGGRTAGITAGNTDTVLCNGSAYVIVVRTQNSEVLVATATTSIDLGVVTKAVTAAQLGALPVDSATVLKTVDASTITISTPAKSTPSASDAWKTVIAANFTSVTNWLTSLTHSA